MYLPAYLSHFMYLSFFLTFCICLFPFMSISLPPAIAFLMATDLINAYPFSRACLPTRPYADPC